MSTTTDLMTSSLVDVFGQRNRRARDEAIALVYAPDVRFYDPEGVVQGHRAIGEKVERLQQASPDLVFAPDGPTLEVPGLGGYLAWTFGPPDGEPVVRGFDIGVVQDGRIVGLHTTLT